MKEKLSKGKAKESELKKLEKANKLEVIDWNRSCSSEVILSLAMYNNNLCFSKV